MISLFCCFFCCFFIFILFNFKLVHFTSSGDYEFIIKHYSQMMRPSLEINWIVIQKFDSVLNSHGYTQNFFIVCEILVYYNALFRKLPITHLLSIETKKKKSAGLYDNRTHFKVKKKIGTLWAMGPLRGLNPIFFKFFFYFSTISLWIQIIFGMIIFIFTF